MTSFYATVPDALASTTHLSGPEWSQCQRPGCERSTGSPAMTYCSAACDESARARATREADELTPIAWFDGPVRPAPSQPGDKDGWRWTA